MSKSNFQKVQEFNKTFDVETYDKPNTNVFDENTEMIDLRL